MKQALLFAAFVFSMNTYAQNLQPVSSECHLKLNSIENLQSKLKDAGLPGVIPGFNVPNDNINHPSRETLDLIQLLDSIYSWTWDSAGIGWTLSSKIVDYLYNADGLPTSYTLLSWTGSDWENGAQANFTYDANNNQTSASISLWNGIAWQVFLQVTSTFDSNNNLTSQVEQFSNGFNLVNTSRSTYTYDANNNLLTEINESWNGTAWEYSEQALYTYVNNNNTGILIQNWNGTSWVDARNATLTYDANNNLISETDQIWNITEWVNLGQYTYTYNANNDVTSELTKSWDGSNWINYSFRTYSYDGSDNLTNERLQLWNGIAFVLSENTIYTYDTDNFIESSSYREFDEAGTVIAGDSSFYYSHTASGIKDLSAGYGLMEVYPNPSNGNFTISSETTLLSLEVFNLLGERVYSNTKLNAQPTHEINLSGYGKGIYIVSTSDGVTNYSRKVIVQ